MANELKYTSFDVFLVSEDPLRGEPRLYVKTDFGINLACYVRDPLIGTVSSIQACSGSSLSDTVPLCEDCDDTQFRACWISDLLKSDDFTKDFVKDVFQTYPLDPLLAVVYEPQFEEDLMGLVNRLIEGEGGILSKLGNFSKSTYRRYEQERKSDTAVRQIRAYFESDLISERVSFAEATYRELFPHSPFKSEGEV